MSRSQKSRDELENEVQELRSWIGKVITFLSSGRHPGTPDDPTITELVEAVYHSNSSWAETTTKRVNYAVEQARKQWEEQERKDIQP